MNSNFQDAVISIPPTPDDVAAKIRKTGVICVDLDGTLSRSDSFADALVMHLKHGPAAWIRMLQWLGTGRAHAKARIAAAEPFDAVLSPYNGALIAWLRAWKSQGVRLVLATAADSGIARAVADHLGIFDEILASDGKTNLKSARKAAALVASHGEKGFVYVGDSAADLAVWAHAAAAVAVHAGAGTLRRIDAMAVPHMRIGQRNVGAEARGLIKAMRPHQWSKNLLVFVPIITSGAYDDITGWAMGVLAFIAFSLVASAVYLVNDALDLNSDRRHPRKRNRPFASGNLPIAYLAATVPIFLIGAGIAFAANIFSIILAYIVLTSFYSFFGKRKVILDVALLALLYSVRLYAGGVATGHEVSAWLLAFSGFLFFNLATMKRYAELYSVEEAHLSGRGYAKSDLPFLLSAGMASGFAACVVLALYVERSLEDGVYANVAPLWALAPLMLLWQIQLWRETTQGRMTDDPIIFAARDRTTLYIGAGVFLAMITAHANIF